MPPVLRLILGLTLLAAVAIAQGSGHTNNWAVLVCSSRFWFNYRHMANTLGMYRTVKRLGIPDSQIILMLADDVACSPRNSFPATVYANADRQLDLYGENIEVDYRGYEVSVESFMRLLTGRQPTSTPRNQRLMSDENSNVFVYMTGHGGDEFLKFQDNEEISAFDIADAVEQMHEKKRYNKMLLMFDTCQAQTMYKQVHSPNVLASGSSELGEPSYSHHSDPEIGIAVIDSYTHHVLSFMEGMNKTSQATFSDLFDTFSFDKIRSHAGQRTDLFPYDLSEVLLTDFFGGVASVDVDGPSAAVPDVALEDPPVSSSTRPVLREGFAAGQARKNAAEERARALSQKKDGLWLGWAEGGGVDQRQALLGRALWGAAGLGVLAVGGWAGLKV